MKLLRTAWVAFSVASEQALHLAMGKGETAREEKVDEGKSRGKVAGRWERRYTSAVPKTILNERLAIWQRADFF